MNNEQNNVGGLPSEILSSLQKVGWVPNRSFSVAAFEAAFSKEGLSLPEVVRNFLEHFGGLVVPFTVAGRQDDVLEFEADRAVKGMGGAYIKQFQALAGIAPLSPIGHFESGTRMLLMDQIGRVFGISDEDVIVVGKSGEEAIGNVLLGAVHPPHADD